MVESAEHVNDPSVYIESGIFLTAQLPSAFEKGIRPLTSIYLLYYLLKRKDIKIIVCSVVARNILDKSTDVSKAPVASIRLQAKQSSIFLRNVDRMSVLIGNKHRNQRHVTIKSRIQYDSSLAV